jgi:putative copper resistance protein D
VTVDEGLILSRFVHYTALLFAFGVCFFPIYAFSGSDRQAALAYRNKYKDSLLATGLIALASWLSHLLFTAASMAGLLSDALNVETMGDVLTETGFGRVWSFHLGLIAAFAILASRVRWTFQPHLIALSALSAASLASLAGVGHTQGRDGIDLFVHALADGTHLLAAGAWLGGLVPLLALLTPWPHQNGRAEIDMVRLLVRFSGMGYLAVALLIGTGAVNSWYLLPSLSRLPDTLYGQVLIVKLGCFVLMLLLAGMNRFWLVPRIQAGDGSAHIKANLSRLRRHVVGEQLLGVLIIALVSALGTLSPSAGQ